MPCYNSSAHLEEAVESALGQDYSAVELIVVDDGSSDDSRAILDRLQQKHEERLRVFAQPNQGPYPARNLALSHARGEYIAFLDADDYWDPAFLRKLHAAIRADGVDVAYCGWQNVGEHTPGDKPYIPPAYENGDLAEQFLKGCPWPIHAALLKRSIIDAIDGFSERYFSSMDYDLWLRILTATDRIKLVPEVLAFYRWHGSGQISAVKWRQVIDAWNVRRDFIHDNPQLLAATGKAAALVAANDFLLENAYTALWRRDLESARRLFRKAVATGTARPRDLKYALPSLLPGWAYYAVMNLNDQHKEAG